MRKEMYTLVDRGRRKELAELFRNPDNCGYLHLKEFQVIADIEYLEDARLISEKIRQTCSPYAVSVIQEAYAFK